MFHNTLKRITFLGIQVCIQCNSGCQDPGRCHTLVTSALWPLVWAPNVSLTVAFKGRLQFSSLLRRTQWKLWPAHQSPHKEQRAVHVPRALDYNTNLNLHTQESLFDFIFHWTLQQFLNVLMLRDYNNLRAVQVYNNVKCKLYNTHIF